jgi:hypothetical protein
MSTLGQFAGRRILLLNWRDLSNPQAGGAEEYAEQIARRFASAGALLTLFTSQYEGAPPYDWAREYLVVREGGRFGVYLAAARHLERYGRRYDAVIDCQNGIPLPKHCLRMNALEQVWWTVYPQVLFVPRGVHTLRAASPRGPGTLEEGPPPWRDLGRRLLPSRTQHHASVRTICFARRSRPREATARRARTLPCERLT